MSDTIRNSLKAMQERTNSRISKTRTSNFSANPSICQNQDCNLEFSDDA